MEISIADQRILLFPDQLTPEEAKNVGWDKKTVAFDAFTKVTSFLNRPKDDDFELTYSEHRYEPFWHVVANAHYVYDRKAQYQITPSSKEVQKVTMDKSTYDVTNGHIHITFLEHCAQDEQEDIYVNAVTGKNDPRLASYLKISPKEIKNSIEKNIDKNAIVVPPQARVSALMRDALSKMIKGINADTILEEKVEVPSIDLYYHPIYAYKYLWKSKKKEAIVEIDGITGEVSTGQRTFQEYLGKVLEQNFLFDIGADAAGLFIPGGSIAVKVAKKYMEQRVKKS